MQPEGKYENIVEYLGNNKQNQQRSLKPLEIEQWTIRVYKEDTYKSNIQSEG